MWDSSPGSAPPPETCNAVGHCMNRLNIQCGGSFADDRVLEGMLQTGETILPKGKGATFIRETTMSFIIKGQQLLNTLSKGRYYLSGGDYTFRPDFFFVLYRWSAAQGEACNKTVVCSDTFHEEKGKGIEGMCREGVVMTDQGESWGGGERTWSPGHEEERKKLARWCDC